MRPPSPSHRQAGRTRLSLSLRPRFGGLAPMQGELVSPSLFRGHKIAAGSRPPLTRAFKASKLRSRHRRHAKQLGTADASPNLASLGARAQDFLPLRTRRARQQEQTQTTGLTKQREAILGAPGFHVLQARWSPPPCLEANTRVTLFTSSFLSRLSSKRTRSKIFLGLSLPPV